MFKYLLLLLLMIPGMTAFAQKESNTWYFGLHGGLDFNTTPPTVLTNGQINTREGVSSISDKATGALLFYSEGTTVWNRNHIVMPNGSGLQGDYSSTQSSIAIPNPGNPNKYYLFTTALLKGVRYSEIDMTLAGGNGDVIPATKNTLLIPVDSSSEKLIAVRHCNGKDYWVITHKLFSSTYVVYLVNAAGVQAPIRQNIGAFINDGNFWEGTGYLKVAADGSKLANAIGPAASGLLSNVELLNFNNQTGIISGPVVQLTGLNSPYGVEFSLKNKFLYVSELIGQRINQYDLNATDINASKQVITSSPNLNFGALQMGPDTRIYVSAENGYNVGYNFLGTINNPEIAGTGCSYVQNSINLGTGKTLIGLPTFAADFLLKDSGLINFNPACKNQNVSFSYSNISNVTSVKWDFGDASTPSTLATPTHAYTTAGTFTVTFIAYKSCSKNDTITKPISIFNCGQGISNIINDYTPILLLDACTNKLTVEDGTKFNPGDTVLLMQMKGAAIDITNTANFGNITGYQNAGNYEYNYVKSRIGNVIELKNILTRSYDIPTGVVQLIRVPYYTDVTITGNLTCLPWNGSIGGVLAFNVQNGISMLADMDVSAKGFRGSPVDSHASSCHALDYFYNSTALDGGDKGEGIFQLSNNNKRGRGKAANAGGGGNAHNAGGGGGGNGGSGGLGGKEFVCSAQPQSENGGIGGTSLMYSNVANKIFMGGAGGTGDENETYATSGGNGGGIVLITAASLQSNGYKIISNGATPTSCLDPNCGDGQGGGGAGGTTVLNVSNYTDNLTVSTIGGAGGSYTNTNPLGYHGPGGGGGGGILWFKSATAPAAVTHSSNGGANGTWLSTGQTGGAMSGTNGGSNFNLILPIDNTPFKANIDSVRFNFAGSGCSSFNFYGLAYVNTIPVASWQWYFGDGGTANTQNTFHNYTASGTFTVKLVITDNSGCKDSILKDVTVIAANPFDFSYKVDACDPLTVQFFGTGASPVNPYWSFGDITTITGILSPAHTYAAPGNYLVRFTVDNPGCNDTINKTITVGAIQADIILTPDTTICSGSTKLLRAIPSANFCWTPTTYLNDPTLNNPTTNTPVNITYYHTAEIPGNNIIINGDFSAGNTGFTSGYNYAAINTTEGEYFVGTSPQAWNASLSNCTDHTSNGGNMLLVNGAPVADVVVWKQQVTVTPNTNYSFSTWIEALYPPNPAQLSFSINGISIGNLITASLPTCTWKQFFTNWNSGNNTTASISIVNKNTIVLGNDFALDDISFAPVTIKRDSVKITVDNPAVTATANGPLCQGIANQLNATGTATYSWLPVTGLSNPNIANPLATPAVTTIYTVSGISSYGCPAANTVTVVVMPKPVVTKSKDTTICKATSVTLFASGGNTYVWSPAATLSNANIPNPVATPVAPVTKYYVTVTNTAVNLCSSSDSVTVTIKPDPVFAVSPPQSTCQGTSVQLSASGGDIYSWLPANLVSDPSIPNPLSTAINSTNYSVSVTESVCNITTTLFTSLVVNPKPVVTAIKSNDIDCSIEFTHLLASGATDYTWTPPTGLSNAFIANPIARPVVTTQYVVSGKNAFGCADTDTLDVAVTTTGKSGYHMPNSFTPNNDGLNDCFGISYWGIIEKVEFFIYNRYGERVFYTNDPQGCWNGMYKGVPADQGNYVYYIKAVTACGPSERKGNVILIR